MKRTVFKIVIENNRNIISRRYGGDKYNLEYNPGEVTTALPNTLGVFCFTNLKYTKWWAQSKGWAYICKIYRVHPIKRGIYPEVVPDDSCIDEFYSKMDDFPAFLMEENKKYMLCYPAIKLTHSYYEFIDYKWTYHSKINKESKNDLTM